MNREEAKNLRENLNEFLKNTIKNKEQYVCTGSVNVSDITIEQSLIYEEQPQLIIHIDEASPEGNYDLRNDIATKAKELYPEYSFFVTCEW